MQLRHGDNLGKGFPTSTSGCGKPAIGKLDILPSKL